MQLHIESDAAYLVSPGAEDRAAGYYNMWDILVGRAPKSKLNAPIHIECILLKYVVASAAEVEIGAVFHNYKTTMEIYKMLQALGYQQSTIPMKTDNLTAPNYSDATLKGKRSKT